MDKQNEFYKILKDFNEKKITAKEGADALDGLSEDAIFEFVMDGVRTLSSNLEEYCPNTFMAYNIIVALKRFFEVCSEDIMDKSKEVETHVNGLVDNMIAAMDTKGN